MKISPESIREMLILMLKDGMTAMEAVDKFGKEKVWAAVFDESPGAGHRDDSLLAMAANAEMERQDLRDMNQAIELWLHGWTSWMPNGTPTRVMAWYWRRPGKRPGKLGRLFRSTNQAFIALHKETAS